MKLEVRTALPLFIIAALVLLVAGLTAPYYLAAEQEAKRVFVLNSYHKGFPFSDSEMKGIDNVLAGSGINVETYFTYMDMKRIRSSNQYFLHLKGLIREGYKGIRFDAVIASDNDSLEFLRKNRDELFPGIPLVFCGINDFEERMLDGRKDLTGTVESADFAGTIRLALKLRPATNNIAIVIDNTTTGKLFRSEIGKIRPNFPQSLSFTYLSLADMTLDELAQKLSELKNDSIVLMLQHFVDKNGISHTLTESVSLLVKSSSVPAFVVNDSRMGFGVLGGDLVSGYSQGETAARMVVKILGGTDVRSIPVLLESPNRFMFDYNTMQRFGIAESDLPQGSIIINKPASMLDRYRNELFSILGVFIILSGLVVYLLFEIRGRRKIERDLRESEMKHRILFESAGDAIFINDEEGRILTVNPLACQRLGYSCDELQSLPLAKINTSEESVNIPERLALLKLQGHLTFETRHQRKDGSDVPTEVNARIITWGGKKAVMSICRDITERKQAEMEKSKLEAQLMQSQKMEAIGQLAGGVAHDFNNILCAITGFGSLLNLQLSGNEKGTQYVSDILLAADRAAALTQSLLAFSRKQHINLQPIDLNAAIRKTEPILTRTIGEDIQLNLQLTEENASVCADSNQIAQILINFAANARDAMPKGGTLTIVTARSLIGEAFIKMHGYGRSGEYVVMTVTDSGLGMNEETKNRIFEPFFTTKEVGKGTGLGLSMVYGIVKQHNGFVDVYSEEKAGTAFKVYFPALEISVRAVEIDGFIPPADSVVTILVVEDDTMVRRALTAMLLSYGHTVIEACDGDEAINKYRKHKDEIHLVLMDVIMPHKSGGDAYRELKAVSPDLKLILMSGYAGDYLTGKLGITEDIHFISKPINPKELFEKIRTALN
jgi:two-component system, cell cycle sensor histidine kinase and response regulator CckA